MQWDLSDDNKVLILRSATELEIDQTNIHFTREAANAKWDPRVKKGYWDGKISYFKSNKYLPAGFWHELIEMGKKYNFPIKISGIERKFDFEIDKNEFQEWVEENWKDAKKIPRQYQIDAAFNIIKYKSSLSELATSAGKTLITYMIVAYLLETKKSKKILMIVPSVDLVVQSSDDFYQYNDESIKLKLDIQQVYAGSILRANCPIIIGTFQSLVKKESNYFDSFDTVIIDESHRASSNSIKNILTKCQYADRKFGLTGTIPKPNSLDYLTLVSQTGPIITSIKADYLQKQGYISNCKVFSIEMSYADMEIREAFKTLFKRSPDDRKKLLNLEQNYANSQDIRLHFITDIIAKSTKNSMVLFHRIEYGNKLMNMLKEKTNKKIVYIDGSVNKNVRLYNKESLENDEDVIMVSSYGTCSTGISINNIHNLYLTESFKSDVIIRQSIGRGLRKHVLKDELVIYDFVDDLRITGFKNYLYKHAEARRVIYDEQSFPYSIKKVDLNKVYKNKDI